MNRFNLTDELLVLIGFLLTSAQGLLNEPKSYGSARLLEAGGRLLEIMDQQGMLDESLKKIRADIDRERFAAWNKEHLFVKLDEFALRWMELIRQRFNQ